MRSGRILLLIALAAGAANCSWPRTPSEPSEPTTPDSSTNTASVSGRVTLTGTSEGIAGAAIRIGGRSATANASGEFTVINVPLGSQSASISAASFTTKTDVVSVTGAATTYSTSLSPSVSFMPAGSVFLLRSGDSAQSVSNASISLSGRSPAGSFTRSLTASGQFSLDRTILLTENPQLDVAAAGYMLRSTYLRTDESTVTLWPSFASGGFDETFTSTIVYSPSGCPTSASPTGVLTKYASATSRVQVAFSSSISDTRAEDSIRLAIDRLNQGLNGSPRYEFTTAPSSGAPLFSVVIDANHSTCTAGPEPLRAATEVTLSNGNIGGGRLVFCNVDSARSANLVLHELGHSVGLRHSSSTSDVMYCSSGRPNTFSARESLIMKLARQRRTGTRWPDNDRQAAAPLAVPSQQTLVEQCGARTTDSPSFASIAGSARASLREFFESPTRRAP